MPNPKASDTPIVRGVISVAVSYAMLMVEFAFTPIVCAGVFSYAKMLVSSHLGTIHSLGGGSVSLLA